MIETRSCGLRLTHRHPFFERETRFLRQSLPCLPETLKMKEFVYYESIKRKPKIRGINECRCDERLHTKTKEFTRLPYTGLVLELEHLKIETRLISEMSASAKGECEN